MSRVFIAPLGFHEDFVLRSLVALRATRGDHVYVVTCSPVTGAVKRAFDGLTSACTRQGLPEPRLIDINCNDFYGSLRVIRGILGARDIAHVYFCAGGGLRALSLIILIALVSLKKPFTLHYEPESGIEGFTVKPELFYNMFEKLSEAESKALVIILSKPGISIRELAEAMDVKEKTARNIVTRLKKRGLVVKKGRREGIEPTEIALALYK